MNVLDFSRIAAEDPEIAAAMEAELKRQRDNIELIAFRKLRFSGGNGRNGYTSHK